MALIETKEGKVYLEGREVIKIQIVDGDAEDEEAGDFVAVVKSRGTNGYPDNIDISFNDFQRLSILDVPVESV